MMHKVTIHAVYETEVDARDPKQAIEKALRHPEYTPMDAIVIDAMNVSYDMELDR